MTQYLDYTGLQEYTTILKQKLGELSGRGRYLSNWNCKTGLPTTEPEETPYPYKSGDYFIVSDAYSESQIGPESCVVYQTSPEEQFGSLTVDMEVFKAYEEPTGDVSHIFAYNKVSVDYSSAHGTEKIGVINLPLYEQLLSEREEIVKAQLADESLFIGLVGNVLRTRWFEYSNSLFAEFQCKAEVYDDITLTSSHIADVPVRQFRLDNSTQYSLEVKKQMVKDFYHDECGIEIVGDMYYGMAPWYEEIIVSDSSDSIEARWTIDGNELPSGVTFSDYGITKSGRPDQEGDSFQLDYKTEKYNYRPNGTSYTGTASTTVETDVVKVNDTYLFDGTNWILLNNTSREIIVDSELSDTSINPVQNKVITEELNKKSGVHFMYFPEPEEESE